MILPQTGAVGNAIGVKDGLTAMQLAFNAGEQRCGGQFGFSWLLTYETEVAEVATRMMMMSRMRRMRMRRMRMRTTSQQCIKIE